MLKKIYHRLPRTLQDYINKAAAKFANNSLDEFVYSDTGKNIIYLQKIKIKLLEEFKMHWGN